MKDNRTVADKKEQFLTELRECWAIKTIAARKCKIGRTMLYEYINSDVNFALKVQEIEEAFVDLVEARLLEMVSMGDKGATFFFLKAKAKERGYH